MGERKHTRDRRRDLIGQLCGNFPARATENAGFDGVAMRLRAVVVVVVRQVMDDDDDDVCFVLPNWKETGKRSGYWMSDTTGANEPTRCVGARLFTKRT